MFFQFFLEYNMVVIVGLDLITTVPLRIPLLQVPIPATINLGVTSDPTSMENQSAF